MLILRVHLEEKALNRFRLFLNAVFFLKLFYNTCIEQVTSSLPIPMWQFPQ